MPCPLRWALPLVTAPLASITTGLLVQPPQSGDEPYHRQEMRNSNDMQYYTNITVGGQALEAIMDTGSIEFVVISDKCSDRCGDVEAQKKMYHAHSSGSYRHGSLDVSLSYGSGDLDGKEAYDNVAVGPFMAESAVFWETVNARMPLLFSSHFRAIVGLGPIPAGTRFMKFGRKDNDGAYAVLLHDLGITHFGTCLGKEPGSSGYIIWNDISHMKTPEMFTRLPVKYPGFWLSTLTDVELGSFRACQTGCGAVIDSGTSLLALPEDSFDTLSRVILEGGCDLRRVPHLRFKLEGFQYSLPPDAYIAKFVGDPSHAIAKYFSPREGTDRCEAALMHLTMNSDAGPVWVMGMPFLREYYSVFAQATDSEGPAVFTAKASDDCNPMNPGVEMQMQTRKMEARTLDASQLRIPSWLHSGAAARTIGHTQDWAQ